MAALGGNRDHDSEDRYTIWRLNNIDLYYQICKEQRMKEELKKISSKPIKTVPNWKQVLRFILGRNV